MKTQFINNNILQRTIVLLFAVVIFNTSFTQSVSAKESIRDLADRHARLILRTSPEWATQLGVGEDVAGTSFLGSLSKYDDEANTSVYELANTLNTELLSIDPRQLIGQDRVTYEVLKQAYSLAQQQNDFKMGLPSVLSANPPYSVNQLFGPQIDLPRLLIAQHPVNNLKDAEAFVNRLAQFDRVLNELAGMTEADADRGIVPPSFALVAIAESAKTFIIPAVDKHPILNSFRSKLEALDNLSADIKEEFVERASKILQDEVYPAYFSFGNRMLALSLSSPKRAGIWRLRDGDKMYQLALNAWGANGLTPEAIHVIGLKEVSRIHAEMDEILKSINYEKGPVGARMASLAENSSYQVENSDSAKVKIVASLRETVAEVLQVAPEWFATIPEHNIEVRRIPKHEQDAASGGYYTPPTLDGSQPGIFWINLKDTADWPSYTLKSLLFHEAVPGHHFQAAKSLSIGNLPLIQNMMWFGDYGEGWALYAEELAVEMGLYEGDTLGNLGRLRMELYRAARLVVDTGLHHKRWSRVQSINYMVAVTGESVASITREIERYAVWPGQAASYKLGMIQFQKIRKKAESELGDTFDIRSFHNALLREGAMPMTVLEKRIDEWTAQQKTSLTEKTNADDTKRASLKLKILDEACETSIALSAAPQHLRADAGVYSLTKSGYKLVKTSTNSFTCIVNRDDARVLKPTCFDEEGTKTIIPKILYTGDKLLDGKDPKTIKRGLVLKFDNGTFSSPRRAGLAYMLSRYNRPVNPQTGRLGFFPPHVMFYAPNLTNQDIGHNMTHNDPNRSLPMIAYGGPQGYMIMITDNGVLRSKSDLSPSCPEWVFREND